MKTKNWTSLPVSKVNEAFTSMMNAFGHNAGAIINSIIADKQVPVRMANLLMNKGYKLTVSQAKACKIMGKNFFGIKEAQKHFGLTLSRRQLAYMAEVPFSEKTLRACKHSHILVAYIPISIVDIRAKAETADVKLPKNHLMFKGQDWLESEVGDGICALEWYLVRKTSVPDSQAKTWSEQEAMVDATNVDFVPELGVMVYTIIGHLLNTGKRLFRKEFARTSSRNPHGHSISIGYFNLEGFELYLWRVDRLGKGIGVASSKKIEV